MMLLSLLKLPQTILSKPALSYSTIRTLPSLWATRSTFRTSNLASLQQLKPSPLVKDKDRNDWANMLRALPLRLRKELKLYLKMSLDSRRP